MVTIPTIDQISGTTVMNKMRSLINNYIDFGTEVAGELSYMMNVIENLPQDITDVYNKATIDAMFANVYTKSETYSKIEVNNLISTIGSFHAVIVDSLPAYGDEGVIYLLQIASAGDNIYEEYIWLNRWELIGQLSNVDLANYYTKTESDDKFRTIADSYTKNDVDTLISPIINMDSTPTSESLKAVTSDGIYTSLSAKQDITNRESGTQCYYQKIGSKTYICWGWKSVTASVSTDSSFQITYPVTADDGNNVYPVITMMYNGAYWADIRISVENRTKTGFKIHTWGATSGMPTQTLTISWFAVITTI